MLPFLLLGSPRFCSPRPSFPTRLGCRVLGAFPIRCSRYLLFRRFGLCYKLSTHSNLHACFVFLLRFDSCLASFLVPSRSSCRSLVRGSSSFLTVSYLILVFLPPQPLPLFPVLILVDAAVGLLFGFPRSLIAAVVDVCVYLLCAYVVLASVSLFWN